MPATAVFGSRGGLTGVIAERFDREGVAVALRARRTFATTGERSYASLKLGSHWMGEVVQAGDGAQLDYRLLGDQGWESVTLYDSAQEIWSRDLHREAGLAPGRIRLRLGGARVHERYRGAYWTGTVRVTGAVVRDFSALGLDHPEQTVWRQDGTTIAFRTSTSGDTDSIELDLSTLAGVRIEIHTRIDSYIKVGDPLAPQPYVHAPEVVLSVAGDELLASGGVERKLPGAELNVALERISAGALPREVAGSIPLAELQLAAGREHPLFITARQRDQSRVWTSALFLTLR